VTPIARAALLVSLFVGAGCVDTEGEVLSTLGGDGGAGTDGGAAADGGPDAAVDPCAAELPCPTPVPGSVTVCGRVLDVETSDAIPGGGNVNVEFFNVVDFEISPSLADTEADECGRYVVENIFGALPPFIVASTDDDVLLGGEYVRVISFVPSTIGSAVRSNVYAMRSATDDAWATASGLGNTFSDIGSSIFIFIDATAPPVMPFQGAPVSGVTITEEGASAPSRDYYFSDGDQLSRAALAPAQSQTGVDGSGIITGPFPTNEYSGAHGSCTFPDIRGAAISGIVQVQEMLGSCN